MEQFYKITLKYQGKLKYDIQVTEFQPGPLSFILQENEKPGRIVHWSDTESYMYIKTEYITNVNIEEYNKKMKKKLELIKNAKIELIDDIITWFTILSHVLNDLRSTL